jgi:hypothetical protein
MAFDYIHLQMCTAAGGVCAAYAMAFDYIHLQMCTATGGVCEL